MWRKKWMEDEESKRWKRRWEEEVYNVVGRGEWNKHCTHMPRRQIINNINVHVYCIARNVHIEHIFTIGLKVWK